MKTQIRSAFLVDLHYTNNRKIGPEYVQYPKHFFRNQGNNKMKTKKSMSQTEVMQSCPLILIPTFLNYVTNSSSCQSSWLSDIVKLKNSA